ncbi:hypothetical protein AURDEDRAFT_124872 [Auricularia subglabra TFB-10046 SS5]|nr:hypothetical protein AURDEDRAFT_124872 [Auricularia subglabra TFB-10046 SS5]
MPPDKMNASPFPGTSTSWTSPNSHLHWQPDCSAQQPLEPPGDAAVGMQIQASRSPSSLGTTSTHPHISTQPGPLCYVFQNASQQSSLERRHDGSVQASARTATPRLTIRLRARSSGKRRDDPQGVQPAAGNDLDATPRGEKGSTPDTASIPSASGAAVLEDDSPSDGETSAPEESAKLRRSTRNASVPVEEHWAKDLNPAQYDLPCAYVVCDRGILHAAPDKKAPAGLVGCLFCPWAVKLEDDPAFRAHFDMHHPAAAAETTFCVCRCVLAAGDTAHAKAQAPATAATSSPSGSILQYLQAEMPRLESLSFLESIVGRLAPSTQILTLAPQLTSLHITRALYGFLVPELLPNVEVLDLHGSPLSSDELARLARAWPRLRRLFVHGVQCAPGDTRGAVSFPRLESLSFLTHHTPFPLLTVQSVPALSSVAHTGPPTDLLAFLGTGHFTALTSLVLLSVPLPGKPPQMCARMVEFVSQGVLASLPSLNHLGFCIVPGSLLKQFFEVWSGKQDLLSHPVKLVDLTFSGIVFDISTAQVLLNFLALRRGVVKDALPALNVCLAQKDKVEGREFPAWLLPQLKRLARKVVFHTEEDLYHNGTSPSNSFSVPGSRNLTFGFGTANDGSIVRRTTSSLKVLVFFFNPLMIQLRIRVPGSRNLTFGFGTANDGSITPQVLRVSRLSMGTVGKIDWQPVDGL